MTKIYDLFVVSLSLGILYLFSELACCMKCSLTKICLSGRAHSVFALYWKILSILLHSFSWLNGQSENFFLSIPKLTYSQFCSWDNPCFPHFRIISNLTHQILLIQRPYWVEAGGLDEGNTKMFRTGGTPGLGTCALNQHAQFMLMGIDKGWLLPTTMHLIKLQMLYLNTSTYKDVSVAIRRVKHSNWIQI